MLLKPEIKLERVTDITINILKKYNIEALILDVDNTLSTHHGQILTDGLPEWLREMENNGIKLMVLSNSKEARVKPFAEKIALPYISLGLKPLPFGYIRALKALGTKRKKTAIVGDQIFTDVLGGRLTGVRTILLTPIKLETTAGFKFKRKIERLVYKLYKIKNTEEA
ncbi:MAG: YqeG family HAD IIIA-type phosphatase [Clostridia bacterium]|nr:YqeG family HAD IIIA-type phosphatase [Oscillospiraceae bacterium]MBP3600061.1 YqeG family HAD IIIA-type phosphatase [Clostridia bacterium]